MTYSVQIVIVADDGSERGTWVLDNVDNLVDAEALVELVTDYHLNTSGIVAAKLAAESEAIA